MNPPSFRVSLSREFPGIVATLLFVLGAGLVPSEIRAAAVHLSIQPTPEGAMLAWNGGSGPYTIEQTIELESAPWSELLVTFAQQLPVSGNNQARFYRVVLKEPPIDPTDYEADRSAVATFYNSWGPNYWTDYGIPPLARLADLREGLGQVPWTAFDGMQAAFDQNKLHEALERGQFAPAFAQPLQSHISGGDSPWVAVLGTYRDLVRELDQARVTGGTNYPQAQIIQYALYGSFLQIFNVALLSPLAPVPVKEFDVPPPTNRLDWVDIHFSDFFTSVPLTTTPPLPDDTNTTRRVAWTNINGVLWTTTYSAACIAVSVGASAHKLGLSPRDIDCVEYNELSRSLGAKAGQLGGYHSGAAKYYASKGYSCDSAWSGPFESAVEEARKALARGCDVALHYLSADGKKAHEEMVTGMTVNADGSAKVETLAWGQGASVTVTGGEFSGKSDGQRYRAAGEAKSYLEGKGTATFYYYCKK